MLQTVGLKITAFTLRLLRLKLEPKGKLEEMANMTAKRIIIPFLFHYALVVVKTFTVVKDSYDANTGYVTKKNQEPFKCSSHSFLRNEATLF